MKKHKSLKRRKKNLKHKNGRNLIRLPSVGGFNEIIKERNKKKATIDNF